MPDTTPQINLAELFRTTLQVVQAVESVYPAGRGKDKFDAVYGQVMAYAPLVNVALPVLQLLIPVFIDNTVALFNRTGLFKKPIPKTPAA